MIFQNYKLAVTKNCCQFLEKLKTMKNIQDLFLPYKLALIAKEKGFNEECLGYFLNKHNPIPIIQGSNVNNDEPEWKNTISAPLYQQITDWFREKHNICVNSIWAAMEKNEIVYYPEYVVIHEDSLPYSKRIYFNNYYEAYNKAIEEAFKLI